MAIPATIDLLDYEATPVTHTFTPIQDGPEAKFVSAMGATILSAQEVLTVEVLRPKTDTAQQTARVVIWDPVEGAVDGQQTVLRGSSAACVFKFPPGATLQEKKNIRRLMFGALANADIGDAIDNGVAFF